MDLSFLEKEFYLNEIDDSWKGFFQQEMKKDYFLKLLNEINEEYSKNDCCPAKENVFRIFRELAINKVKVVVLGQDPYYQTGIADGIAFSSGKLNYVPASLRNIFLELKNELNVLPPRSGNLLK
jgi:uracil-DNA glycosylase